MKYHREFFKEAFKAGYRCAKSLQSKNWKSLNEWWFSNSTFYNRQSTKITSKWLEEANNKFPAPEVVSNFPNAILEPKKDHDKLLRYIVNCVQNTYRRETPIEFNYPIKDALVKFKFVVDFYEDQITTTGGTLGGRGVVKQIVVELPLARFLEIYKKMKEGQECYSDAEDFITDVNLNLAHELTHSLQNLSYRGEIKRGREFKTFKANEHTKEISFFMYYLVKNELESIQSEAYKLYTKRGTGIIPHNLRRVQKNFIRCLTTVILRRSPDFREITQQYNTGEISLMELINNLPECNIKLLLFWTIFVLGPNKNLFRYDELIKNDPDYSLKDNFNLNIIANNVENLKQVFLPFENNQNLQWMFVRDCFYNKSDKESVIYLNHLFSSDSPNDYLVNNIIKWRDNKLKFYPTL